MALVSRVEEKARSVRRWTLVWRVWSLAAVAALVAALTVACGPSGEAGSSEDAGTAGEQSAAPAPSPVEVVRVAYRRTVEQTAKVALVSSVSGAPDGAAFRVEGEGVMDFGDRTAEFTMRMPMMGGFEMRQIGAVVYQKFPEEFRAPGQEPWVEMDLDALARERYGEGLEQMQGGAGANDPAGQLDYLRGVSDSVEEVGEEEVRGEPTTHYRAEVDLKEAAGEGEAARRAYEEMEEQLGTSTLPVDVWIDRDGLLRRYQTTTPVPLPASASAEGEDQGVAEGRVTVTEEFYDFGTPVSVEPPPANQTVEVTELMEQQTQQTL